MSAKLRYHAAPATLVLLAVVLALTVLGLLRLNGAEAAKTQPNCGETITGDTTVDSDLVDCPNNGIVIGADDITLDLNGHRIDGDGTRAAGCNPRKEFCDIGVANDRHDGVTVKGGSLRDFGIGVLIREAHDNRVLDVSSKRNEFFGFAFGDTARSLIRDSAGSDNIPPEGDGMGLFGSHDVRILDNTFRNNPGPGVHVADSDHNLIKGNLFSHSSPGVLIGGDSSEDRGDHNEVRGNRFVRNHGGISVGPGSRNVLTRNHFSGEGIGIDKGRHNLVARNVVVEPRKTGIRLGVDLTDGSIGGVDNIVRRNVVKRSGGNGFLVNRKGTSVLRRNIAIGAKGDGFHVENRATRLAKNRARRNADLGIDAVQGVVDGGGNRASGNGDKRQCVNVKCH